jgi:hypothetical protein
MRIAAIVTIMCALAWGADAAAKPDWHAALRWRAYEKPRALDAAQVPATVYETAGLHDAQLLIDNGEFEHAMARLSRLILDSANPREVCRARILVVRVGIDSASGDERRAAVSDLAARLRSRRSDDDCRLEGDALVGSLAYTYDLESAELDPMALVPLWDAAASIATTEARRTGALHDRALVYWRRASWGDGGAARWRAAAIAADQAVAADPADDNMASRARDARWNAMLFARAGR